MFLKWKTRTKNTLEEASGLLAFVLFFCIKFTKPYWIIKDKLHGFV
jgi:hypothetical protein